ncbi:GNAT family N-acetyltransferase [Fusobacterium sp.]|uniref:GNAT family N-acetyltransferase n=1 Tax=Fusobacterium sp. TaxID=68766 RepID=UPI002902AA0E|nr:GNAT family N-acetyltransferase [Fusobacterium sp.]MDU1912373.1 GNAT family N-acetyltransferase [Fusobacterium sp.]
MLQLKKLTDNKKKYIELLLLADPEEKAIDKYINDCEVFCLIENEKILGQCAVIEIDKHRCEIKNIAICETIHKKGYGRKFLNLICDYYKDKYFSILVGTADPGIEFYEKCNFKISHRIKNFFIDNYDEEIFDNGIQCIDMIYLERKLK